MPNLQRERQFIKLRSERFDYVSNFNKEHKKIERNVKSFLINKNNELRHIESRINSTRRMQLNLEQKTSNSNDKINLINERADKRIDEVEYKLSSQINKKYGDYQELSICFKDKKEYKNMNDYDYNVLLGLYNYDYLSSEFKYLYYLFDASFCQGNMYNKIIDENDVDDLSFISELLTLSNGFTYPEPNGLTLTNQLIQLIFNKNYIEEYSINELDLKEKYDEYKLFNKKIIDNLTKDLSKINSYEYKEIISKYLFSLKELLIILEPNTLLSIIDCDPEANDFSSISNEDEDLDNSLFDVITNGNNKNEFNNLNDDILNQLK